MKALHKRGLWVDGLAIIVILSVSAFAQITVGPNVMVSSGQKGWVHAEYTADADPSNAGRIMICTMRFSQTRNQLTSGIYVTFNGGRSWQLTHEDKSSRFAGVWDPGCAYTVNGGAVFTTLANPETNIPKEFMQYKNWQVGGDRWINVFRSDNGGRSWGDRVNLNAIDHPTVRVDHTSSPYRGRIYIFGGTQDNSLWLVYSPDNGQSWIQSAQTKVEGGISQNGQGTILRDGTFLMPYRWTRKLQKDGRETHSYSIAVAISQDGGQHLLPLIPVAETTPEAFCANPSAMSSDLSEGPFQGRAYIVWSAPHRGRCAVLVSWSDDAGQTWSSPVVADDAPSQRLDAQQLDKFVFPRPMPQIAVNKYGVVGISWYDVRENREGNRYRLRFSASLDGGSSWLPSVKASTHPFIFKNEQIFAAHAYSSGGGRRTSEKRLDEIEVRVIPSPRNHYRWNSWPGDYVGMAASSDNAFHVFWIDNRSGMADLYTSRITVSGTVNHANSEQLQRMENITSALEFQITSSVWDSQRKRLLLEYQFLNTTTYAVVPPFKVKVSQLESDLGVPTLLLESGRIGRTGTILDLTQLIPEGGLAPGQTTKSQQLIVKFDNVNELLGSKWDAYRAIPQPIRHKDVLYIKMLVYGSRRILGDKQAM